MFFLSALHPSSGACASRCPLPASEGGSLPPSGAPALWELGASQSHLEPRGLLSPQRPHQGPSAACGHRLPPALSSGHSAQLLPGSVGARDCDKRPPALTASWSVTGLSHLFRVLFSDSLDVILVLSFRSSLSQPPPRPCHGQGGKCHVQPHCRVDSHCPLTSPAGASGMALLPMDFCDKYSGHWFPRAAVTKCHTLGGTVKCTGSLFSHSSGARIQTSSRGAFVEARSWPQSLLLRCSPVAPASLLRLHKSFFLCSPGAGLGPPQPSVTC